MLRPMSIQSIHLSDDVCQLPDGRKFDYRMLASKMGLSLDSPSMLCYMLKEMGLDRVTILEHVFASFILQNETEALINKVSNTVVTTSRMGDTSIILSGTLTQWERAFIQTCNVEATRDIRNVFNACYYCFKAAKLIDLFALKATKIKDQTFILEFKSG